MTVDYDVPRVLESDREDEFLDNLPTRGVADAASRELDVAGDEPLELATAELSDQELSVRILPKRADEFTCAGCFLVHHKSRVARRVEDGALCPECA